MQPMRVDESTPLTGGAAPAKQSSWSWRTAALGLTTLAAVAGVAGVATHNTGSSAPAQHHSPARGMVRQLRSAAHPVPPSTKYVWHITDVVGEINGPHVSCDVNGCRVQVNEVKFFTADGETDFTGDVSVSASKTFLGKHHSFEAGNMLDGEPKTGWLADFSGEAVITFDFSHPVSLTGFAYQTGNNWAARDPISWTFDAVRADGTSVQVMSTAGFEPPLDRLTFTGMLAMSGPAPPPPPPSTPYGKRVQMKILAINNNNGPINQDTLVQMEELEFWEGDQWNGGRFADVESCTCFNPDGSTCDMHIPHEGIDQLTDRDWSNTKWLSRFVPGMTIECTLRRFPEVALGSYKWNTGNDHPERDPWSWEFYAEQGGEMKLVAQEYYGYLVPDTRKAWTEPGYPIDYNYHTTDFGRKVKMVLTELRTGSYDENTLMQMEELEFWEGPQYHGGKFMQIQECTCTLPDGSACYDVPHESISMLYDRNWDTKFLTKFQPGLTLDCTLEQKPNSELGSYKWKTGNDASERDPWSWTMYAEKNGEMVTVDGVAYGELVPSSRKAWTEPGYQIDYSYTPPTFGKRVQMEIMGLRQPTDLVQVSELEFWEGDQYMGGTFMQAESCTCTYASGAPCDEPAANEQIDQLTDRDWNSKWLAKWGQGNIIIECTLEHTPNRPLGSYKWMTGNDADARDPWEWKFYAEVDGEMKYVGHETNGRLVPGCRKCWTEPGYPINYSY